MQIEISINAYRKMMAAIATTSQEVSGFGLVRAFVKNERVEWKPLKVLPPEGPYNVVFYVEDIWLLDMGSSAETEIREDVAAKFWSERLAEGYNSSDFKLWWHRHPLAQGWSGTDEHCIRHTPMGNSIAPKRTGWTISLVWCTHTGWNGRYDQYAPGFTIHLPVTVAGKEAIEPDIQRQLHDLRPKTTQWAPAKWNTGEALKAHQTSLWDDDLPWYQDIQETRAGDDVVDALSEMDPEDERWAVFVLGVGNEIDNYVQENGNIDQTVTELIVARAAHEYGYRDLLPDILEAVR